MTYKLDHLSRIVYLNRFKIVPDFTLREEGQQVIFTITTKGLEDGTVVYWRLEGVTGNITNSDFSSPASPVTSGGQVTINNNTANFTVVISADVTTEGTESFRALLLLDNSLSNNIKARSATVTIIDTSNAGGGGGGAGTELFIGSQIGSPIVDMAWNPSGTKLAVFHNSSSTKNYYATVYNVSSSYATVSQQYGPTKFVGATGDHNKSRGSISWSPDGTKLLIACRRGLGMGYSQGPYAASPSEAVAFLEVWQGSTKICALSDGIYPNRNLYPYNTYPDGSSATYVGSGAAWVSNTKFIIPAQNDGRLLEYDYQSTTPQPETDFPPIAFRYRFNQSSNISAPYNAYVFGDDYLTCYNNTFYWRNLGPTGRFTSVKSISYPTGTVKETALPTMSGTYALKSYSVSDNSIFTGWDSNLTEDKAVVLYQNYTATAASTPDDDSSYFSANQVAISTDGSKVAISPGKSGRDEQVQLYNVSGNSLAYYAGFGTGFYVKFMKWNPQSSILAVATSAGEIKLIKT